MGRQKHNEDSVYARLRATGWRMIAIRIPPEMNKEMERRAQEKGMSFTSYINNALYWYMRNESRLELQDALGQN